MSALGQPMLPGAFHALLKDVPVRAFNNATAYRQARLSEGGVDGSEDPTKFDGRVEHGTRA